MMESFQVFVEADLEVVLASFSGGSPKVDVGFCMAPSTVWRLSVNFFTWVKGESARNSAVVARDTSVI